MSENVNVSAVRDAGESRIEEAIRSLCEGHGVRIEELEPAEGPGHQDPEAALLFAESNGWTTILWPEWFTEHHFPFAGAMSERLGTTVSAILVPDGSSWRHGLFARGECLDRFGSYPDLWVRGKKKAAEARSRWKGDAARCAEHLGVPVEQIAPYFVYWPEDSRLQSKAFEDDRTERNDSWAFADFWARIGIRYPGVDDRARALALRDFSERLPTEPFP